MTSPDLPGPLLLTGANSASGQHFLALLDAVSRAQVKPTDLLAPAGGIAADLTDPAAARALVEAVRPAAVLHLAGTAARDEATATAVNVTATRNLLDALVAAGRRVRFVFVSSAAVYGATPPEASPLPEETPLAPVGAYGRSKAEAEAAVRGAGDPVTATVLRPFNLVGPGLRDGLVPVDFARRVLAVKRGEAPPEIRVGNLSPVRDFVDVRDAARAYLAALAPEAPAGTWNVATGVGLSIADLLGELLAAAGVEARVVEDPALVRPVDAPHVTGDPAAIRRALGWSPGIPRDRSLADLLASLD